jgi:uncharacterized protein YggE
MFSITPDFARRIAPALVLGLAAVTACAPASASTAPPEVVPMKSAPTRPASPAVVDTGVVRVSGSARIDVATDRARLRFAMETEGASASDAADKNAEQLNAVLAAVRPVVGTAGTVETSGYSLNPVYSSPERGGAPRITGYRIQNQVLVTLTDVDRVGPVLDAAVRAGANRVSELSFFASDPRPARLQAIREATARAREEAEVLAAALGGQLGEALDVNVSGGSSFPEMARFRGAEMAMADTPIEPGTQAVSVTVNLTFRLEGPPR